MLLRISLQSVLVRIEPRQTDLRSYTVIDPEALENVTITILDIIYRPVYYLKLNSALWDCPYVTGNILHFLYEPNRLMLSVGFGRWNINITIIILDNINRPVY
jgi:hypothetical protein